MSNRSSWVSAKSNSAVFRATLVEMLFITQTQKHLPLADELASSHQQLHDPAG